MYEELADEEITELARRSFWLLPEHAQRALIRQIQRRGLPGVAGIACDPRDMEETEVGRQLLERYRALGFGDEEIRDIVVRILEDR